MEKIIIEKTKVREAESLLYRATRLFANGCGDAAIERINELRGYMLQLIDQGNMVEDDDAFNGYVLQSDLDTEEIRKDAAIAALPKCIETAEFVLKSGQSIGGPLHETVANMCCQYADALVERLKEDEK